MELTLDFSHAASLVFHDVKVCSQRVSLKMGFGDDFPLFVGISGQELQLPTAHEDNSFIRIVWTSERWLEIYGNESSLQAKMFEEVRIEDIVEQSRKNK